MQYLRLPCGTRFDTASDAIVQGGFAPFWDFAQLRNNLAQCEPGDVFNPKDDGTCIVVLTGKVNK